MRLRLRTACRLRSFASLALAFALLSSSALAQQRGGRKPQTSPAQIRNLERARRAQAITLLIETADRARLFDDLFYRARVQALAADALWPHDSGRARAIFRRAWEAAAASDKEEQEAESRETGALPGSVAKVTEARDEILRRAARRDSRLADIFLRELTGETGGASVDRNEPAPRSAAHELSTSGARRLALAYELLEAGEPQRAAEITAPVINEGVSVGLLTFIAHLSPRDWNAADALYLRLLERAAADPGTDANAVLLLSSRFVSPTLLVFVDEFGSLQFRSLPHPLSSFSGMMLPTPSGKQAFYTLAAGVLSRILAARDEALTVQDLTARFYAIGRLLPLYENTSESFAAYAPTLRASQSALFNLMEANRRDQVSSQFSVSSLTPAGYVDPLRSESDQLSRAGDAGERERIALSILKTAVRERFWDRARRAAAEIEDTDKRRLALSFIQVHQIKAIAQDYGDEKEDDFESVLKFVRGADVPPFAKAWGLAQAAVVAARKRGPQTSQKVVEIINEAEGFAASIGQGAPERVAAYGVVTMTAARFNSERAWSTLREYVKSANAVEDFTGDETSFDLAAERGADDGSGQFSIEAEVFRLDGIFETMAHLDFDKALAEARALDGDVPRARATIAVARTTLERQGMSGKERQPE